MPTGFTIVEAALEALGASAETVAQHGAAIVQRLEDLEWYVREKDITKSGVLVCFFWVVFFLDAGRKNKQTNLAERAGN